LFADERKRPIPAVPRRIGVVTSAQAAAFQDICRVLAERFPAVEVVLAHTLVQGDEAPAQIVAALAHLGSLGSLDVVILARGGGSLEDLWAFNNEAVARAIVACPVPVVTGVGHETDITIADFAADLRAPTPSAAAMAVVPDRQELLLQVSTLLAEIHRGIGERLNRESAAVASLGRELGLRSPSRRIAQQRQAIDDALAVMRERVMHHISMRGERLRSRHVQLKLLDPLRTLDRGFALITDGEGRIVRSISQVEAHTEIRVRLRDGSFPASVRSAPEPLRATDAGVMG
jgi:exodeoxyribonuclease VII large subunit